MSDSKEKIKDLVGGFASAGSIAAGISTANPILVITGTLSFFSNILNPTIRNRRDAYLESLHDEITELGKNVSDFEPENLANNQCFASAVLKTTEISLKTHQTEKMKLLRNSVINSVLDKTLDDDLQQVFVNSLETITPTHVIALREFSKLEVIVENDKKFHELTRQYEDFLSDLDSLGYLRFHDNSTGAILLESAPYHPPYKITNKGKNFLAFVTKSY